MQVTSRESADLGKFKTDAAKCLYPCLFIIPHCTERRQAVHVAVLYQHSNLMRQLCPTTFFSTLVSSLEPLLLAASHLALMALQAQRCSHWSYPSSASQAKAVSRIEEAFMR